MRHRRKCLVNQLFGEFAIEQDLSVLVFGTDKLQRVLAHGSGQCSSHNTAAHAFAITHNGCFGFGTKILDKMHTEEDRAQLIQYAFNLVEEHLSHGGILNQGIDHIKMALADGLIYFQVLFTSLKCHVRCFKQLVGDAT